MKHVMESCCTCTTIDICIQISRPLPITPHIIFTHEATPIYSHTDMFINMLIHPLNHTYAFIYISRHAHIIHTHTLIDKPAISHNLIDTYITRSIPSNNPVDESISILTHRLIHTHVHSST